MSSVFSSEQLKAEALNLGFSACGIAEARPVDEDTAHAYRQWIADGGHGDMRYLAENIEKRLNPTLLLPDARSIVVVAMNYAPAHRLPEGEYQIADYALGHDYHDVMKQRLRLLSEHCQLSTVNCQLSTLRSALPLGSAKNSQLSTVNCQLSTVNSQLSTVNSQLSTVNCQLSTIKVCVDTVPILERYWAWQAGLGFIGRNRQLIIPQAGSMFFLGEIITTLASDHYDQPIASRCGNCHRCIDACPTGVLKASPADEGRGGAFLSSKCLSYQTIEHRGALDPDMKGKLGDTIYGCDRCQQVCPWNRFATPTDIAELQPANDLLNMTREQWHQLTVDDYRRLFRGSAVKRAKYEGLMRNIQAARQNGETDNPQ